MRVLGMKEEKSRICDPGTNGRILKSDYYGRSFRVLPFRRPIKVRGSAVLSVLSELSVGESGVLVGLDLPESVQNHLMHMGFVPDALVTALRRAPAGDPTVYAVDGMEIALRHETAGSIRMRALEAEVQEAEGEQAAADEDVPELAEAAR
jgi:Fe2+ transport system protein FeoA